MNAMNERQIIKYLISVIHLSLQELAEARRVYGENNFRTGQLYAYAECLEILQLCPAFRARELNYDIELRYNIK